MELRLFNVKCYVLIIVLGINISKFPKPTEFMHNYELLYFPEAVHV